jgi:sugar lactone lactonase YvrE
MTVFADDSLALADTGTGTIKFFTPDGSVSGQIGETGSAPGQFGEPTDVLRDALGTYYVAEADTNRIQRVDVGGQSLNVWALPPTYAFNGPHLAAGPDGSLFATEVQSQSLLRYAPDGNLLDQWQNIGPVTLIGPVGIYFHEPTNQLFITDVSTHQVYVFTVQLTQ